MAQESRWRERIVTWGWMLLACYPLVDFVLRNTPIIRSTHVGSVWDKLILLIFGFFFIKESIEGRQVKLPPFYKAVLAFMLLGVGYMMMDLSEPSLTFEGWRAVFLYMFVVFLAPFFIDAQFAKRLLQASLWTGVLIALIAVYQWIVKAPIPAGWVDAGEHVRTRAYSIFGSPNVLGSYLVLMFPIAAGLALTKGYTGKQRLIYGGMALLFAAALFMTYTRGAWMALFIALLVIGALVDKRLFIGIVLAAIAVSFVPQIHARVSELFTPLYWKKAALNGRIARSLLTYDVMRKNPLFGAGLGHYGGAVAARHFGTMYSDNYYAKTLAEMGLLGLFSFVALLFKVARDIYRHIWKRMIWKHGKFIEAGLYTGILAVMIHNAVENIFEVPAMNFLFWFMVSLIFIISREVTGQTSITEEADANHAA
ncbi:O-antigen ligase family protein [Fodinisporobacter ferrooxydans]|uniref:O-antigen ligase family protein n=1 Tax=Fodinisporobacter ferrooxydans TaxID=2901836 RepID=A0ABY4CPA0_9BACL|nr:O-antigen ligase family protein [Alicyclobacillaceae bacterium MYW30-H2]